MTADDKYAFMAVCGGRSYGFDIVRSSAELVHESMEENAAADPRGPAVIRALMWKALGESIGSLVAASPRAQEQMSHCMIWLALSSKAFKHNPEAYGFRLRIGPDTWNGVNVQPTSEHAETGDGGVILDIECFDHRETFAKAWSATQVPEAPFDLMALLPNARQAPDWERHGGSWDPQMQMLGFEHDAKEMAKFKRVAELHGSDVVTYYLSSTDLPGSLSLELQFKNDASAAAAKKTYRSRAAAVG